MDRAVPKALNTSAALAVLVLGVIFVLMVPLPTVVLDLLITVNLTASLLILLATIHAGRPLDFSTLPTILLLTALMRLSLNVASTRLILLQADAGKVIRAFGDFVVGGNYVVGIIIFLILVIIQFVVITRGQNRISEVAARFTLDAMPGKQMAIDADLNAGILSSEEAKERRRELANEAEFYGAMDGAGKFIRGDALAGLIITIINLLGGLAVGCLSRGLSVADAFSTYAILTVGDGLVSQIPAVLISTASGILVTKSANESVLGDEIGKQVLTKPAVLATAGGILLAIAFFPGIPAMPFLVMGSTLLLLRGRSLRRQARPPAPPPAPEPAVEDLLPVDRLCVEIGYRLIPLVDQGRQGGLLEQIASLRRQFAMRTGFVIPPVRVKDNVALSANEYRVLVLGNETARGTLQPGCHLAMDPTGGAGPVEGTETVEPAFGLPARWVLDSRKEQALASGWTVIDPPSVLVTHLTEILKRHSADLLTRQDVSALVEGVRKRNPAVVEELIPSQLTLGQVQRVLAALLREQVSIRNMDLILEALADAAAETKDHRALTEKVRLRLARSIVEPFTEAGRLKAVTIDPPLERRLMEAFTTSAEATTLPAGFLGGFVDRTAAELARVARGGKDPVLVTRAALRPFLSEAVTGAIAGAAVLSYQEAAAAGEVETVGQVRME